MKLTQGKLEKAIKEALSGRELIGSIQRHGGDKDDYKKAYELMTFGPKKYHRKRL